MDLVTVTAAVVAIVAAPVNWWSRVSSSARLELVTKPVATLAIGALAVSIADGIPAVALVAAVVGFALCLVGDVALLPAVDRFLLGLGSFALGHVAFIVMFTALGLDHLWLGLVALVVAAVVVGRFGRSILRGAAQHTPSLKVPVACYLAVITVMAVAGWSTGRVAGIIGTTLFVASDSVLGWRMFVDERRWMAPTVMATYHGALTGLALCLATPSAALADSGPAAMAPSTVALAGSGAATSTTSPPTTTTPDTTTPATTTTATTTPATTTPATTDPASTSTSSSTPPTSLVANAGPPVASLGRQDFPALAAAVDALAELNPTVAVSVWRNGATVFRASAGNRLDGTPVDTATPFAIASLSKLVTSRTIAALVQFEMLDTADAMPWDELAVPHDPAWSGVTVRELLDHMSGMPADRARWFSGSGTCREQLAESMAAPPTSSRGTWSYSNGNYCALGLLIEHLTGMPLADATRFLLWEPLGVGRAELATATAPSDMAPYPLGTARLERLGAAGAWLTSSDAITALLASVGPAELATMHVPAVLIDQYGWGHTGSVLDAVSCAWVLADGTVVTALVGGRSLQSGGAVCNIVLPALGSDLGLALGTPVRFPQ